MGLENTWHVLRGRAQKSKQSWNHPLRRSNIEMTIGPNAVYCWMWVLLMQMTKPLSWLTLTLLHRFRKTEALWRFKHFWGSCADWWACGSRRSHDWHCWALPEIRPWTVLPSSPSGKGLEGENWRRLFQEAKHFHEETKILEWNKISQKVYCAVYRAPLIWFSDLLQIHWSMKSFVNVQSQPSFQTWNILRKPMPRRVLIKCGFWTAWPFRVSAPATLSNCRPTPPEIRVSNK